MSYTALYRTYRPSNFDEVAGQKHIVTTLKNAIIQNKIAHAYLFCGPRGTGKTSIAKIFAKAVNCLDENERPCGKCENCLSIADGSHPDIVEIDAASNNGVEEVRSLIEKVKYAPIKGKYKVYIIDEVHMMTSGAFNALLKTIEEPPAHVIFILATTEPQKVLPTIISRCQRFDFNRVSAEDMVPYLKNILEKESIRCDDEVIRIISQLADGGMRDSLSILDQCIAYAQNDIQVKHINEIYGIATTSDKMRLFEWISIKDVSSIVTNLTNMNEKGIDMKRLTLDLVDLLKESIIYEYTKDKELLNYLNVEESNQLIALFSVQQRFNMIDILLDTFEKYRNASSVVSYFEVALLKCLSLNDQDDEHVTAPANEIISVSRETSKVIEHPQIVTEPIETVEEDIVEDTIEEEKIKQKETLEKVEQPIQEIIEPKIKPLKDDFVLRLLSGANKPEKQKDLYQMTKLSDYLFDLDWAKYANLLNGCTITASGSQYMVLCCDNQAAANEINELDSSNQFIRFTTKLLEKNKKVFAITKEQEQRVIKQFREAMQTHTLPEPMTFEELTEIQMEEVKEKTEIELVEELFGKDQVVIVDES